MNWVKFSERVVKWLTPILLLTAIWWLFNLPDVFLALMIFTAHRVDSIRIAVLTMIVLMPFVTIPATTGVLAVARKYESSSDAFSFFKFFLKYYRRDYLKSMTLGLINTLVLAICYISLQYYASLSTIIAILFYLLLFLIPFYFLVLYSFLVDQELKVKTYFSNSLFLFIIHPVNMLTMIANITVIALLFWVIFKPLLVILFPGLCALIVMRYFKKSIDKEIENKNKQAAADNNSDKQQIKN